MARLAASPFFVAFRDLHISLLIFSTNLLVISSTCSFWTVHSKGHSVFGHSREQRGSRMPQWMPLRHQKPRAPPEIPRPASQPPLPERASGGGSVSVDSPMTKAAHRLLSGISSVRVTLNQKRPRRPSHKGASGTVVSLVALLALSFPG